MKILRRKSDVASPETGQDAKLSSKDEFIRGMPKNLTTLDFIGLVALTMLQPVLFRGLLTDDDSHPGNQGIDKIKKE